MFFKIDNSSENNCFTSKEMQIRGFRSLITFITFEYLNSHNVTIKMYTIRIYIAGLYDFFSTINYGGFKICMATWGYSLHTTSVFGLSRSRHSHHLLSRQSRAPFRCCAGLFPGSQDIQRRVLCLSSHNRGVSVFYEAWILKIVEGTTCLCTVCHSRYLKIKNSKI